MIIILSGQGRSGKDTAARILQDTLDNCQCIAYADYLKEIVQKCFGLKRDQLYGDDKEVAIEGLPIRTKSGHVTTHCWTPRKLLQFLGTDVFRTINPAVWVNVVKEDVAEALYSHYIITDGRFPNEIEWVLESGGIHIRIEREEKDYVSGTDHGSETSLPEFIEGYSSFIIHNNQDLNYLKQQLLNIVNKWRSRQWQLKSSL